ncbi:MAG: branched-chain amino acid ABC transporter substrate-binding protein [Thermincola sp.]|jgi:ABC-type branched-subunit amino acid transport system substrate-binding protein|nr:branched-chain amino acid ABC transporter substrate-binding protein [Thermincola sp.]MDT3704231.1 branched-chain amino acid ABC transporter substrate-binding protein [Thermincola sp.]
MTKLNKRKSFVVGVVLLFSIMLVLAGCGGTDTPSGEQKGEQKQTDSGKKGEILIGTAGPFTGPNAEYGKGLRQGTEIAAEEWNAKGGLLGKEIKLVHGDTQGDSKQATTVANKFVSQDIVAVLGATFSNEALAANPIFEQAKLPAVSGVASAAKIRTAPGNAYFFRTVGNDSGIGGFLAKFCQEGLNAKTIAFINDGTAYTKGAVQSIKAAADKLGLKTVFDEGITPGEKDYTATITKLKQIAPDVIVGGTFAPEGGLLKKQAFEAKLDSKFVFISGNQNPTFAEIAGKEAAKGSFDVEYMGVMDVDTPLATSLIAKVKEKYNENVDTFAGNWYDAANALFKAIEAAGTTDGEKVREALLNLKTFDGATGPVTFTEVGERKEQSYVAKQFNGEAWVKYNPKG